MAEVKPGAALPACVLGWIIPGAGHLYLKRFAKAGTFFGIVAFLFGLGLALEGRLEFYFGLDDPLALLRTLAQMGNGVSYFVARQLGFVGEVRAITHEYGNTLTEVAGLLNILVILDAYDTALGRRD